MFLLILSFPFFFSSYDFAFVDADKRMYEEYFELLLKLVRFNMKFTFWVICNSFWSIHMWSFALFSPIVFSHNIVEYSRSCHKFYDFIYNFCTQ